MNNNILLLGDSGCGKTTFLKRLQRKIFDPRFKNSKGVIHNSINIENFEINFYDTSGQEKYRDYSKLNNNIDIAIIFFRVDSKLSFKNIKFWKSVAIKTGAKKIIYFANKKELGKSFSNDYEDNTIEISVKNDSVQYLSDIIKGAMV